MKAAVLGERGVEVRDLPKPEPKPKRHVMRIHTGGSIEKVVFDLNKKSDDDDDGDSSLSFSKSDRTSTISPMRHSTTPV